MKKPLNPLLPLSKLFKGHQPFPRTAKSQLDSECRGDEYVDLSSLNFLKIPRSNFRPFRQFILGQPLADAFAANIRAERLYSQPFFFGNCHDILRRLYVIFRNDTYIVKRQSFLLPHSGLEA